MPSICGLMMQHSQELASTNSTTYIEWTQENSHPTQCSSFQQRLNISCLGWNCRKLPNWTIHDSESSWWNPVHQFPWKNTSTFYSMFITGWTIIFWKYGSAMGIHSSGAPAFFWSESTSYFVMRMHQRKLYAEELQDHDNLIFHILVAATDIRDQPRQLVPVKDSISCYREACMWGNSEQFLWRNWRNRMWVLTTDNTFLLNII